MNYYYHSLGHYWKMEEEGLTCVSCKDLKKLEKNNTKNTIFSLRRDINFR